MGFLEDLRRQFGIDPRGLQFQGSPNPEDFNITVEPYRPSRINRRGTKAGRSIPGISDIRNDQNEFITNLFRTEQQRGLDVIGGATEGLSTAAEGIGTGFDARLRGILDALPIDPFSDEFVEQLRGRAEGDIHRQSQQLTNRLASAAGRRGLSSGGSLATQGATDIGTAGIAAKNAALTQIMNQQFETNEAANRFRAGLEGSLGGDQDRIQASLAGLGAQLEASGASFFDPQFLPRLAEDLISAQFGEDEAAEFKKLIDDAIAEGETDFTDIIGDFLTDMTQFSGNPMLSRLVDTGFELAGR